MVEEWRDVVGYKGRYKVSSTGNFESLVLNGRHPTSKTVPIKGYHQRNVRRHDGTRHLLAVHRAVLEAFVGPCPTEMEAAHLDGNPLNNDLTNLVWATKKENSRHSIEHGTKNRGTRSGKAKLDELDIVAIRELGKNTLFSTREVGKIFGVHGSTISKIQTGAAWGWLP